MRSLKLLSLTTCCLALSVATAQAQPKALSDAELDNVVAGFVPGFGFPSDVGSSLSSILAPFLPQSQPVVLQQESQAVAKSTAIVRPSNGDGPVIEGGSARVSITDLETARQAFRDSQPPPPSFPFSLLQFSSR